MPKLKTPADETNLDRLMVPLWPDAGRALDLRRGATYEAAKTGNIPVKRYGKLLRVSLAWLRRQGQVDED
jgi:hypothetical protein